MKTSRPHRKTRLIRRRWWECSRLLLQCRQEFMAWRKQRAYRNSDLQQHSFKAMPEIRRNGRQSLSLTRLRRRLRQNRRVRRDTFNPQDRSRLWAWRLISVVMVLGGAALFIGNGGFQVIGGVFREVSIFKVEQVRIVGCDPTLKERLRLLTGINLYQTSLLELDTQAVAAGVERDPWVEKAEVKRDWPSEVVVTVQKHQPVAIVNRSTSGTPRLFYVDRTGTAFLDVQPGQDVDYPVITGLDRFTDDEVRRGIFTDIYQFLKYAGRNNPNLPVQSVSEVHVNEQGELVIYLVDHTFPIFFGRGNIYQKYTRLVKVLESLYREKRKGMLISGVEYIRMDYLNDKVLVAQSESG